MKQRKVNRTLRIARRRSYGLVLGIFLASLMMGVGYAATSGTLTVSGTANVDEYIGLVLTNVALADGSAGSVTVRQSTGTTLVHTIKMQKDTTVATTVNYTIYNNTDTTYYFEDIEHLTTAQIQALGLSTDIYNEGYYSYGVMDTSSYTGMIGQSVAPHAYITISVTYHIKSNDASVNYSRKVFNFKFTDQPPAPATYSISYNQNLTLDSGETVTSFPTDTTVTVGDTYTFPSAESSNHVFLGWATSAGATTAEYTASQTITPSGDMNLYGVWKQYSIYFDGNGGNSQTIIYGKNKTATISSGTGYAEPTKSGYTFSCWSTTLNGSCAYTSSDSITINDYSSTLYAVWITGEYKIIFHANGGYFGTEGVTENTVYYPAITGVINQGIGYMTPTYPDDDYEFSSWQASTGWNNWYYTEDEEFDLADDLPDDYDATTKTLHLYAHWDSGGCVMPGTMITLADGSQEAVEDLDGTEQVLVWNFDTNSYDAANITFVHQEYSDQFGVVKLHFGNNIDLDIVYEHGFFDVDLQEFVYLDSRNVAEYVGHRFVYQDSENTWGIITLESYEIEVMATDIYGPVSYSALNFYSNGLLTMPGDISGLFNYFEVDVDYDSQILAYNQEKKAADIAEYGSLSLADYQNVVDEFMFDAFNGQYLGVALGKGLLTWESIQRMADHYGPIIQAQNPEIYLEP